LQQKWAHSPRHLEQIDDAGMDRAKQSGTIATVLPGVCFFLHCNYPPARKMIEAGISAGNWHRTSIPDPANVLLHADDDDHRLHAAFDERPEEAITASS